MNISFDPLDPREVADTINFLRLLGAIDAAVQITVEGEPTLTEAEARKLQVEVQQRFRLHREKTPPSSTPSAAEIIDNISLDNL